MMSSLLSTLSSCLSLVMPPQYSSSWSVPVPLASLQERRAEDGSIGSYSQGLIVASLRNCPLGNEFFSLM